MRNIVISLFDYTGIMVNPWAEAGYECWIVDVQHPAGVSQPKKGVHAVRHDLSAPWMFPGNRDDIAMVFAFPPCDHLAVSGARWFRGKGLRALQTSIGLFASAAEFCEWGGAPYMIENPVSTIATYWRKPDHIFHPYQYTGFCPGDNYTKKTCLWTGNGFVMPDPKIADVGRPDDRIHKAPPGEGRKNFRSATPEGFARAVFEANHKACKVEE
jgi:hypothetical protein